MENAKEHKVSILQIPAPEVEKYIWDFKIPPHTRIQENIKTLAIDGYHFKHLKFYQGILRSVSHSWSLHLHASGLSVEFSLQHSIETKQTKLKSCKVELMSKGRLNRSDTLSLEELKEIFSDDSKEPSNLVWTGTWYNDHGSWNDSIDVIRITFELHSECAGQINVEGSERLKEPTIETETKELKWASYPRKISTKEFFMSKHLSDVTLECGGQKFYVHRFILACKSSVFNRILEKNVPDSNTFVVVINDVEPRVLQELLRHLYLGHVQGIDSICEDLFAAADKYDIAPLKASCELKLLEKLNSTNAFDMYDLGDIHDARILKKQALEFLKRLKGEVFKNHKVYLEFAEHHRDILFKLFTTNDTPTSSATTSGVLMPENL